jgi:hypothetical protein
VLAVYLYRAAPGTLSPELEARLLDLADANGNADGAASPLCLRHTCGQIDGSRNFRPSVAQFSRFG